MSMNTWEHVLASGGTEEVTLEGVMQSGSLRTLNNDPESVGTPAPPPPPPPPSGVRRLGMYDGNFTDDAMLTSFGHYPGISTTYYTPGTSSPSVNVSRESTKINNGISPLITTTTKNTQRLVGIAGNADSTTNTADRAWLDTYLDSLNTISLVDPNVPVYAVLEHEFDVGVQQGSYTGAAAGFANYGQALTYFYNRAKVRCPLVRCGFWVGGSSARHADILTMLQNIAPADTDEPFSWGSGDPYAQSGTNPSTTWAGRLNDFRTGVYSDEYNRLCGLYGGTIPLAITETGINKASVSDATMAGWIGNLPAAMETSDVLFVIYFNRDSGSNGDWQIDGGTFQPRPLSVAAMGTAFQTVNGR